MVAAVFAPPQPSKTTVSVLVGTPSPPAPQLAYDQLEPFSQFPFVDETQCLVPVVAQLTFGDDGRTLRVHESRLRLSNSN